MSIMNVEVGMNMKSPYADDSLALHTDLYQINMAEAYWADGIHNRKAVFELFFRNLPFGNGYAVFAGLERVLDYLREFRFSESDLAYLKNELGYKPLNLKQGMQNTLFWMMAQEDKNN